MSSNDYQENVLNHSQKVKYSFLVLLWFIATIHLAWWWFSGDGITEHNPIGFVINTAVLCWVFIFPGWFYFNAGRMKTSSIKDIDDPYPNGRIALVVTKAPSEPWSIVSKTLLAMLGQNHYQPFDVWVADEQPTEESIEWCSEHNVQISTRFGVEEYHLNQFPRRTRSKEGNLSYFYDKYGYESYDFVIQFDADHVPEKEYLHHIMIAFKDPQVGYVACPSICDSNSSDSWLVRARLWVEAGMHGALQAGYSSVGMPFCIGSHYAVRVAALETIVHPINKRKGLLGIIFPNYDYHTGGVGPELAEDHSTSLAMVANGWKGAFSINSIAHGDGADSFASSMQQEFQWARSLTQVLLSWSKGYFSLGNMGIGKKSHFLLGQLWYIFFSLTMLVGNLIPVVAIVTDRALIKIDFLEFTLVTVPVTIFALLPLVYLKKIGVLRPSNFDLISLESIIFSYIRWPWALWGVINGIIGSFIGIELPFKVTKKGSTEVRSFPVTVLAPYLILALLNAWVSLQYHPTDASGYLYFTVLNSVIYSLAVLISIVWHVKDNWKYKKIQSMSSVILPTVSWLSINVLVMWSVIEKLPDALKSIVGI